MVSSEHLVLCPIDVVVHVHIRIVFLSLYLWLSSRLRKYKMRSRKRYRQCIKPQVDADGTSATRQMRGPLLAWPPRVPGRNYAAITMPGPPRASLSSPRESEDGERERESTNGRRQGVAWPAGAKLTHPAYSDSFVCLYSTTVGIECGYPLKICCLFDKSDNPCFHRCW